MATDITLGLETFEKKLRRDELKSFDYGFKIESESFMVHRNNNPKYITPIFSLQHSTMHDGGIENAQIVLISAAGATGKSELVKRLSVDMHCPVIDLGKTDVVASNSLTGLLFKNLKIADAADFLEKIKTGNAMLLIDALDEGYQKTNTQGYFDYLNDLVEMLPDKGAPFVLLGRTNAIELATLFFEEKGVKTSVIKIEPFTIDKAKEFIDKQVNSDSIVFQKPYQEARDHIVESIGGFFKDQRSITEKQYEHFIGYAPVLLAISTFFKDHVRNYQQLLEELKMSNAREISLILDIVERILRRDKEEKVKVNLLERILEDRDDAFREYVMNTVYTPEEQCARVLYIMLDEDYPHNHPTNDEAFDLKYSEGLKDWIMEHPFLNERKPANIVFESYILARLITNEKYKDAVYQYLNRNYESSYMFFYIYDELNKRENEEERHVELPLLPYLYASLKALDKKDSYYTMELFANEDNKSGEVSFEGSDENLPSYTYTVDLSENDRLEFRRELSNVTIDAPIIISFIGDKIELCPPANLHCNSLEIGTTEIFVGSRNVVADKFVIETDDIQLKVTSEIPKIQSHGKDKNRLIIISSKELMYPFREYLAADYKNAKLTPEMKEIYQKLRRTLMMFRSHSKGCLARLQAKIDNRIGTTEVGRKVIATLLEKHIIYKDEHMYKIDNESMNQQLGVTFDGMRNCIISEAMLTFINDCV